MDCHHEIPQEGEASILNLLAEEKTKPGPQIEHRLGEEKYQIQGLIQHQRIADKHANHKER